MASILGSGFLRFGCPRRKAAFGLEGCIGRIRSCQAHVDDRFFAMPLGVPPPQSTYSSSFATRRLWAALKKFVDEPQDGISLAL